MINFVFMLNFDTMRHYPTLFDTISTLFRHYATLFRHYSTLFDTIWHYSILFDTISTLFRHYFDTIRHYFGISLTPFRHYSTLFRCEISLAGVPIRTHWTFPFVNFGPQRCLRHFLEGDVLLKKWFCFKNDDNCINMIPW